MRVFLATTRLKTVKRKLGGDIFHHVRPPPMPRQNCVPLQEGPACPDALRTVRSHTPTVQHNPRRFNVTYV